jgi:transposase-like protein
VINLSNLIDEAKCFQTVRQLRWPEGITCPHCSSQQVIKNGKDETQPQRQRYTCSACRRRFDDLTGTIFAGHHQPLQTWILCLYLMGLNLSSLQIAKELGLHRSEAQEMTTKLRQGVIERRPEPTLSGAVECDEVYVTAGHKGNPEAVKRKGRAGRRRRLKGDRGRGTLAKEKPPIFGMFQRAGQVVIQMLENVKQVTIGPLIKRTIDPGSIVYTDEYDIYNRLNDWGYTHETVCHAAGEFARDGDGDGFCEVHVNTLEGFWSLLRSWLRPHRGISQEKLPLYLSFFEFVHNVRVRGKALLGELIALLVSPPRIPA